MELQDFDGFYSIEVTRAITPLNALKAANRIYIQADNISKARGKVLIDNSPRCKHFFHFMP